jgi:SAM-dependent methyltransferase
MTSQETSDCCLCGEKLGRVVVELSRPDKYERAAGISENNYRRQWVECPACGALCDLHLSPEAHKVDEWATNYYEIEEAAETLRQKFRRIMALPPEGSDNRQRVERVHRFMDSWQKISGVSVPTRRVVDIGSGMGVFLAAFLEKHGWQALAIEPSASACQHLNDLDMFEVRQGLFSAASNITGADLITFNKVVEHIRHPQQVLRDATTAVAPHGILYVEVPHKLSATCHPPEHFILGALHHHLYSQTALTQLLERTGWEPIETGTIFEPSGKISTYTFACLPAMAAAIGKRKTP